MRTIHIIDTSIYLVILRIPNYYTEDQLKETQLGIREYMNKKNDHSLLLPFGTIIETGNHIANFRDGRKHQIIKRFVEDVRSSNNDESPYSIVGLPNSAGGSILLNQWIDEFEKNAHSGIGFVDGMCISIFHRMVQTFPQSRVRIWAYDRNHLNAYDHHPS